MRASKEPRRPNLATIVGSGLAIAAAGSLLAFSSLAEQAGLQGLATGGLQPAQPQRGGATHAITVPAPATAPPGDPRDELTRRVREVIERTDTEPVTTTVAFEPAERPVTDPPKSKPEPERPDPIEPTARVVVEEPEEADPVAEDGPPYGHAYGHHKNKNKDKDKDKSKPAKKHEAKPAASDQPVYARNANDESKAKPSKQPKLHKVGKAPKSNGKAKGHDKHSHSNGKGKGHSKHGY